MQTTSIVVVSWWKGVGVAVAHIVNRADCATVTMNYYYLYQHLYGSRRRPNQLYDGDGKLLADGRDLCDCLNEQCPGCHFPCHHCGSEKCGEPCRRNRMIYYSEVEVEGANCKMHFPGQPPKPQRKLVQ